MVLGSILISLALWAFPVDHFEVAGGTTSGGTDSSFTQLSSALFVSAGAGGVSKNSEYSFLEESLWNHVPRDRGGLLRR